MAETGQPVDDDQQNVITSRYGTIFQNEGGDWRFQWNASRAGTPPECALQAAASRLPAEHQRDVIEEINRALEGAGQDERLIGGSVNSRHVLG